MPPRLDSGAGPEGTMHGQLLGTPGLHGSRAGQRSARPDRSADRCLWSGGRSLRNPDRRRLRSTASRRWRSSSGCAEQPPRPPRRAQPHTRSGVAGDLPEGALEVKRTALCYGDRTGPGHRALSGRRAGSRLSRSAGPGKALRWARKHRTAVATAAGLLVTSTIALGVGTVLVTRERNEAQVAGQASTPGRRRHVHQGCRELA